MKAILCRTHGLPHTLVLAEQPLPPLQPDEVLVKVAFCGVNFPDTLLIQNKYQFKPPLPFSPGGEVAGIVEAVGSDVKHINTGDRVVGMCGWGGFAEYAVVKSIRTFVLPPDINLQAAAATFYNYATAYHALSDRAGLMPGEKLLVLGAAGGAGMAAIELGKLMGATVIAAASTDDKLKLCQRKGADYLINYSIHNVKDAVKDISQGAGIDVIFDVVGGAVAESAIRAIAWRGRYLVVGFASGNVPTFAANIPLLKGASIAGVFWSGFAEKEPAKNASNMNQLMQWHQEGKISQQIYKTYSLANAPQALQDMMDRKIMGKAVVQIR
ncbi:MAG: putative NAD(P)H quinone oxidoreductase, PIG3 family [Bacteroidetes bacterium OLB12]|nr:MAG: putative NAD(P)H quinone oxidoreductase, PIG3 family [Bacteroidetes bacterium OLB12]HNR74033.1 NADPH:quinone oxidoreductase family protein [Cyclobacteriaceae bacterium]